MEEIIILNIIESLLVGLIVINPRGDVQVANRAASDILGYDLERLRQRGWIDFFEMEGNEEFNQVLLDVIQYKEKGLRRTVPYVKPSGEILTLSLTSSFLTENDTVMGVVILIDDLTELHRLYAEQERVLEEKSRLQAERAESLRHLSQSVAHQIRNPVTSIGGFALRLKNRASEKEPESSYIGHICEGAERLEKIVKAVNDYAALPEPKPRLVSVEKVVEQAVKHIQAIRLHDSGSVQWDIDLMSVKARVDPDLVRAAAEELLLNSIQAMEKGRGRISVRLGTADGGIQVEIEDTGKGIAPEDLPYVQDPFFTTRADAVGMGLCKVKRICLEHKGRLEIHSLPGKGTRVTLFLAELTE
jgi:PAS domain S-box-containing protein